MASDSSDAGLNNAPQVHMGPTNRSAQHEMPGNSAFPPYNGAALPPPPVAWPISPPPFAYNFRGENHMPASSSRGGKGALSLSSSRGGKAAAASLSTANRASGGTAEPGRGDGYINHAATQARQVAQNFTHPMPFHTPAGHPPPFWLAAGGASFPVVQTPAGTWTTAAPAARMMEELSLSGSRLTKLPRKKASPRVISKLSNDDMRKHCLAFFSYKGSLHSYAKSNDMKAQRTTLGRAMEASGLKGMKARGLPLNESVQDALDKYLGERVGKKPRKPRKERASSKAKAAADGENKAAARKIVRLSNEDVRKHCMALYQWDKSLLSYVKENGLRGQRSTLARAFRGSGLQARKEQQRSFPPEDAAEEAVAIQEALDKYLGKRKEFTPIDARRGLSIVELRKHMLGIYGTTRSLRCYCQDNQISSKRATLARVFTASGLHAMKQLDPKPDQETVREQLETYLKTKRKKRKKQAKAQKSHLKDVALRDHLRAFYETPQGTSMRGFCQASGIEKHRGSMRAAWTKSGLKALKESNIQFGTSVSETLDGFFATRRQRQTNSDIQTSIVSV